MGSLGSGGETSSRQAESSRANVASTVSGLSGFASAVETSGLREGLARLNLLDIEGRSAAEVVGRIADHISEQSTGQQRELLRDALRGAMLEAAQIDGGAYEDLEVGIGTYLQENGTEGLVELFLSEFASNLVWYSIESHVEQRSASADEAGALRSAIHVACQNRIRELIAVERARSRFNAIDWFGEEGRRRAQQIVADIEQTLKGGNDK